MKWYKHLAKSIDNPFIRQLMYEFGADAYLVFFGILEIYADNFSPESDWKLTINLRYFHEKFLLSKSKIKNVLSKISEWEVTFNNDDVVIFIPKFKELLDNYTKDTNPKNKNKLASDLQETFQPIKNKEIEVEEEKNNGNGFILPEWINKELWDSFIEMRKKSKKAPTEKAKELLVKKLKKFKDDGYDIPAIMEEAIEKSWQGFYEPKNKASEKSYPWELPTKKPVYKDPFATCVKCGTRRLNSEIENGICIVNCGVKDETAAV